MAGNKPQRKPKRDTEPSMLATNVIIFSVTIPIVAVISLYVLQQDAWVKTESYWLISRAAAMAAFIVLTLVVLLGIVLSHPRNKDTWRLTPKLLPWHQALMVALFILLGTHLFFTVTDPKSGVTFHQMWYPVHAKYYPLAMVIGAFGLYSLLAVTVSVGIRKWFRFWLPLHRFSWITWILVFFHGLYGGSDTKSLMLLYVGSAGLLVIAFLWRHWTDPRRRLPKKRAVESGRATGVQTSVNEIRSTEGV